MPPPMVKFVLTKVPRVGRRLNLKIKNAVNASDQSLFQIETIMWAGCPAPPSQVGAGREAPLKRLRLQRSVARARQRFAVATGEVAPPSETQPTWIWLSRLT